MALGRRGWLEAELKAVVANHVPDTTSHSALAARALTSPRARARRYLEGMLRESGLLYGTPSGRAPPVGQQHGPEETLFLAVLRTFGGIALDLGVLADAAPGPRAEQLLLLFAALSHRLDDAEEIHRRIEGAQKEWPLPERLWRKVEVALEARALSLAADPYYGLVLHNGAVYVDGNLFGRMALSYFATNRFPRAPVERLLEFGSRQKALLVKVLVGLVCAERSPSFPTRRAVLRQIDDLHLPEGLSVETRRFARRAFERPASMARVVREVRSRDMKRFIFEQTVLASLVDGRRSPREVAWTNELGALLGYSTEQVHVLELSMAEFYARHRDVVDVFTLATGVEVMGEEWVDTMSASIERNYRALMQEIRETGELSVLLARAARGQPLSSDEKRRMRAQLIDIAKAVPALALFAAPGGLLLLIALSRVMPLDLLPSAFREEKGDDEEPSPRSLRRH